MTIHLKKIAFLSLFPLVFSLQAMERESSASRIANKEDLFRKAAKYATSRR